MSLLEITKPLFAYMQFEALDSMLQWTIIIIIFITRHVDTLRGVQDWTEGSEPLCSAPASLPHTV